MTSLKTKRDYLGYVWIIVSPALAFMMIVWDDGTLQQMIDHPTAKLYGSACMVVFWIGFCALFMAIDKLLIRYEKNKGEDDERIE